MIYSLPHHFLLILFGHRISEEEYVNAMKEEISKVVKLQEELDIDVLVHGEPEVILIYEDEFYYHFDIMFVLSELYLLKIKLLEFTHSSEE